MSLRFLDVLNLSEYNNKCYYCKAQCKSVLALRLHITKCQKCPEVVRKRFHTTEKSNSKIPRLVPSPSIKVDDLPTVELPLASISSSTEISLTSCNLDNQNYSASSSSGCIDAALARALYASGAPLSMLESHYWKEAFRLLNPNYEVPSRYLISNTLLDAEYERVKTDINTKIKDSVALSLIVDCNILGNGVLNFIITTPLPIFYKAIYPEERKTADYLSKLMIDVILEIGEQKFVAVITDITSNMKAAWRVVHERFPHISCVGCVAHSLYLIFKDILNISIFADIIKEVSDVIKYIKRTHMAITHFKKCQQEKYGRIKCTLKLPSKTKRSGAVIMLDSYVQNREALEALVARGFTITQDVENVILNENIWTKIDENLKILKSIADRILKPESDTCFLSEIPPLFQSLEKDVALQLIKNTTICMKDKRLILDSISKRRDFCLQPIHFAANMLDPRYRGSDLKGEEVIEASNYIKRLATHMKKDVFSVLNNMYDFKTKTGHFGSSNIIWIAASTVEPRIWWETFAHKQILHPIATRILSVPSSSAASERNFSNFRKIHNISRNRLDTARVSKLVSIHSNLRLRQGCMGKNEESEDEFDSSES